MLKRVLFLLGLLIAIGASVYYENCGKVQPVTLSETKFSAERAKEHVKWISQEPHPGGSEAHEQVKTYIINTLEAMGMDVELQSGFAKAYYDDNEYGYVTNLVTRLKGTNPEGGTLLVMAHYDSVSTGPGANDDGTSVGALLETLRALKAGKPLENDVLFVITDREEDMMFGANYFYQHHPEGKSVDLVLNFEARGVKGNSYMFETGMNNYQVVKAFSEIDAPIRSNSMMNYAYKMMDNDTDMSIYRDAGYKALNFAYIGGSYYYHTTYDNVENIGMKSLQQQGEYMQKSLRNFGNLDLSKLEAQQDGVYFDYLGRLILYPESLAIWLLVLFTILAIMLWILQWKNKKWGIKTFGIGILMSLLGVAISGGATWGLTHLLSFILPQSQKYINIAYATGWSLVAILIMSLSIYGLFTRILQKLLPKIYLPGGSFVLYFGIILGTTFFARSTSFMFLFPGFIYVICQLLFESLKKYKIVGYLQGLPVLLILPFVIHMLVIIYEGFGNAYACVVTSLFILWMGIFEFPSGKSLWKSCGVWSLGILIGMGVMIADVELEDICLLSDYVSYKIFEDGYVEVETNNELLGEKLGFVKNKSTDSYVGPYTDLKLPKPQLVITREEIDGYDQVILSCETTAATPLLGKYHLRFDNSHGNIKSIQIGDYSATLKDETEIVMDIEEIKDLPITITVEKYNALKGTAYLEIWDKDIIELFDQSLPSKDATIGDWIFTSTSIE